jgi:glycosyltransferase involved in cell wall biosynthesis
MSKGIAIIIPAYNEEKQIGGIIRRAKHACPQGDVIVVNDGSKDRTARIAREEGAILIDRKQNSGKGSVARIGCDYAYNKNYEKLILMDADGQHQPEDIPRFLKMLEGADIIFSYRVGKKQPVIYRIGNWGLNRISLVLYGIHIKDTQSGFRAFNRKAYKQIRWASTRYSMESEMIARAKNLRYRQIPIKKIYSSEHKGTDKGTSVKTGLEIGWKMIVWKIKGVPKRR